MKGAGQDGPPPTGARKPKPAAAGLRDRSDGHSAQTVIWTQVGASNQWAPPAAEASSVSAHPFNRPAELRAGWPYPRTITTGHGACRTHW